MSAAMNNPWPALPLKEWQDTYHTLHLWTQIVGKIRLTLSPLVNHWWNCSLRVSARGLTTGAVPYNLDAFEIEFDFIDHRLEVRTSSGGRGSFPLIAEPVASFYEKLMALLDSLDLKVSINPKPQELGDAIPFPQDTVHRSYDPEYAHRAWRVFLSTDRVLNEFRARFIGKCSPVQFFWGSFDLACTRFSGRSAPPRKGVISREAYSQEVISAGFWPGGGALPDAAFYAYAAPSPAGFSDQPIPSPGFWSKDLGEFILMYEDVRNAGHPRQMLLDFWQSTYVAGANLAHWDRKSLER
jgi:hypothetical protein